MVKAARKRKANQFCIRGTRSIDSSGYGAVRDPLRISRLDQGLPPGAPLPAPIRDLDY